MSTVDAGFATLMRDMESLADNNCKYLKGEAYQRKWMLPTATPANWDPTDITDHGDIFDRQAVNDSYESMHDGTLSTATVADTMGCCMQIGYMAMMERAFRDRHKTVVRSTAHDCGRKRGHGSTLSVHTGSVLEVVTNMFTAEVQG